MVLGGHGTGKTSLAVAATAERIATDRPVLLLAGDRQSASRLRDRVTALSGRTTIQPQVRTIHSAALSSSGSCLTRAVSPDC